MSKFICPNGCTHKHDKRIAELESTELKRSILHEGHGELLRLCGKQKTQLDEYEENTEILLDRLDEFSKLLKAAKCPDDNCDGNGTVLLGEYQHDNGEVEQHLEQCQWCCERDAALNGEDDAAHN